MDLTQKNNLFGNDSTLTQTPTTTSVGGKRRRTRGGKKGRKSRRKSRKSRRTRRRR